MKIESQTSISQLPVEISKLIQEVSKRSKSLDSKLNDVHPEKIYDSYVKMDAFRRELYEIDLLSQNLMDAYRLYAAYAFQAVAQQPEEHTHEEPEESEASQRDRVEQAEDDKS